jgi:hypothetical protein
MDLSELLLEENALTGVSPQEVCDLRSRNLRLYSVDCPSTDDGGVICPIPDCCSFCRRADRQVGG